MAKKPKIRVEFTDDLKKLDGGSGYWKHYQTSGRIVIFVYSRLSATNRLLTLVHELAEALATNLTETRIFHEWDHVLAEDVERVALDLLLESRKPRKRTSSRRA